MAALGDNLIETPPIPDGAELRYVDHVERKLLSPAKETFSPSKPLKRSGDTETSTGEQDLEIVNALTSFETTVKETSTGEQDLEIVNALTSFETTVKETSTGEQDLEIVNAFTSFETTVKDIANESGQSDSGLDSSNGSEEVAGAHFVERQESHVAIEEPDSINSPVKMVNDLFSFVDEPQSLDAMNNNSEQTIDTTQFDEPVKQDSTTIECYLGMDVDLHETIDNVGEIDEDKDLDTQEDKNDVKADDAVDSAEMNLYWYNSTLDLDPKELEKLGNSENDPFMSSVQMQVSKNYYKDKLEDAGKTVESEYQQDIKLATAEKREGRERWSPAFESASSRFLDLASEMKSETKASPDKATGTDQALQRQHPWGLDDENKVVMMPENGVHDELPNVSHLATDSEEMTVDEMDGDVPEEDDDIDQTDAIGYMKIKDKDTIIEGMNMADGENKKDEVSKVSDRAAKEAAVTDSQTDKNIKIESEHIVSTVVQKAHSQMMKNPSDFKSDSSVAINKKVNEDTVDGLRVDGIVEETVESNIIQSVEQSVDLKTDILSTAEQGRINESDIGENIVETIECTTQRMVFSEPDFPADVEEVCEPIEVRRKFRLVADVEEKLISLGANLIEVENFIDEYLDDENYSLCLSDCWLRLRNKKFEMKVNETLHGSSRTSIYNELNNETEVKHYLLQKYGGKLLDRQQNQDLPLDVIVDKLGFTEFATFETVKKSYQLDGCVVDLELTDFGQQVCEVEAVAVRPNQVLKALDAIKAVVVNLDFLKTLNKPYR